MTADLSFTIKDVENPSIEPIDVHAKPSRRSGTLSLIQIYNNN